MPKTLHACLALAIAAGMGAGPVGAPQQAFRSTSGMVPLFVTVIGPDGRLVTDLERDDFEVLDNGRPQQIDIFDNGIQPINIVIMLDMSGSMEGNLGILRRSAVQMFTRLLPEDRARVGNFGSEIRLSPSFTNDEDELIRSLWLDLRPGGATPLWRAVNVSMTALAPLDGRRVVLVLSDGKDTGRRYGATRLGPTLDDVIERARSEAFMVYGIGMRSRRDAGRPGSDDDEPDSGLSELAVESGGGYFELEDTAELGATFARVADELHRQYLIAFTPPERDGNRHEVTLRLSDPDLTPRTRRSYVAPGRMEMR